MSFRALRRHPVFAAVCTLILALGLGANALMFSIAHGLLIDVLPYPEATRLVVVQDGSRTWGLTEPELLWLAEQSRHLEAITGYVTFRTNVTERGPQGPERVPAIAVQANFFDVLGSAPFLGRSFTSAEDAPDGPGSIIVSHRFWQRRLGADPGAIGRTVRINGTSQTVVGVLTPDAQIPEIVQPDVFVPLGIDVAAPNHSNRYLTVVARRVASVSATDLTADLARLNESLQQQLTARFPQGFNRTDALFATPLRDYVVGDARRQITLLLGAVGLVLLLVCVNVATLTLGRTDERQREIAIRTALGASRGAVMRSLLTESAVLSLVGGGIGLGAAVGLLPVVLRVLPAELPLAQQIGANVPTVVITFLLAGAASLVIGLVPAVQATGSDLRTPLTQSARGLAGGPRGGSTRRMFIVVEMALALALIGAAGLVIKSLDRLQHVPLGFDPAGSLAFEIAPPSARYPQAADVIAFYDRLMATVDGVPGVIESGAVTDLPFSGSQSNASFEIEGAPARPDDETVGADYRIVTVEYLRAMRIALLHGRAFEPADRDSTPAVAVVSRATAERYWGRTDVVGERIRLTDDSPWMTIVGVTGDVHSRDPAAAPAPTLYLPRAQTAFTSALGTWRRMAVVVRTRAGMPETVAPQIRAALAEIDPEIPISSVRTMDDLVGAALASRRMLTVVLTAFAGTGLLLAAIGMYGVTAHAVGLRLREMGVRLALGATPGSLVVTVVASAARSVAFGVPLGLAGAVGLGRVMESVLFGVTPSDPAIMIGVAALLTAVALASSWIPARRTAGLDPASVLRDD